MYLITEVIKLWTPLGNISNIYQETEQSDDALVGDPHDEGLAVRGEAPVRGGREVLAGAVRGADRQLAGQGRPRLGGGLPGGRHLNIEVGRHLVLKQEGGASLLGNGSLPA